MEDTVKEAIGTLVKNSRSAKKALDAMQFSQAAVNVAQAYAAYDYAQKEATPDGETRREE